MAGEQHLNILPDLMPFMSDLMGSYFHTKYSTSFTGDHSAWLQPPVDLVPALLAAGGLLLQLPTAQAGWRNMPNQIVTTQNGQPGLALIIF